MAERSSIFDMIGPVMIGPSSSHTAGVVKIGLAAVRILGATPTNAEITFYNSFARTYEGHGSDRAIIAGLLGMNPDDERIRTAFDHAQEANLQFNFRSVGNASTYHPNTIRIKMSAEDSQIEVVGISKGGGVIEICEIDGFKSGFAGGLPTLIVMAEDKRGSIAFIANVLAYDDCNIATMSVSRKGKNQMACLVIEIDSPLRDISMEYIRQLPWVKKVLFVPPFD